jgi:hypothetical protein
MRGSVAIKLAPRYNEQLGHPFRGTRIKRNPEAEIEVYGLFAIQVVNFFTLLWLMQRPKSLILISGRRTTKRNGGEKDWFHLLLEIERRFRAEERKNLRSECEQTEDTVPSP